MACATCGMATKHPGEFHPHAFCMWKLAGLDPWDTLHWVNSRLGIDMSRFDEKQPPLIRDLSDLVAAPASSDKEAPDCVTAARR